MLPGKNYYTPEDNDRLVWSNGEIIISKGKVKKLGEPPNPLSLHPLLTSHEVT